MLYIFFKINVFIEYLINKTKIKETKVLLVINAGFGCYDIKLWTLLII